MRKISDGRFCYGCGTTATKLHLVKGRYYEQWYLNHDAQKNALCFKCLDKYIRDPLRRKARNIKYNPKWNKINNGKLLHYRGKQIWLGFNPRKHICQRCGKRGFTHMHHFAEYHDDDPLRDTIELCRSCHGKESWKLGQYEEARKHRKPIIVKDPKNGRTWVKGEH